MSSASIKKIIPCKKEQLVKMVLDIEKYPEFVPWCIEGKVYDKNESTDLITFTINTADNHKQACRDVVEVINKHLSKDHGFAVIADTANSITPSDDISSTFTILTDNPA